MWWDTVIRIAVALLPVLAFLFALYALDSYKLLSPRRVATALAAGAGAAAFCFAFNTFIFQHFPQDQDGYARFGAPVVEELAKAAYWIFVIATARVAFMVDAAICAFATGAGFALFENISFLPLLDDRGIGIWILRGFGTAIMHGGVAALGAIIAEYLSESRQWRGVRQFAPGLLMAMVLHSLFNNEVKHLALAAAAAVMILPIILGVVFYLSERSLRRWLGGKLDSDIEMLSMIAGEFENTPPGMYLRSLRDALPPQVCGDMLAYLHLSVELSAGVKGALILRNAGVSVPPDEELESKLAELEFLEKSIGPTGMLALRPLLSRNPRDLWELHQLKEAQR